MSVTVQPTSFARAARRTLVSNSSVISRSQSFGSAMDVDVDGDEPEPDPLPTPSESSASPRGGVCDDVRMKSLEDEPPVRKGPPELCDDEDRLVREVAAATAALKAMMAKLETMPLHQLAMIASANLNPDKVGPMAEVRARVRDRAVQLYKKKAGSLIGDKAGPAVLLVARQRVPATKNICEFGC